jgi:hypothetical protein
VHSLNTLSARANAIKCVTRHIDRIVASLYRSITGLFLLGLSFLSLQEFLLTSVLVVLVSLLILQPQIKKEAHIRAILVTYEIYVTV